MLRTLLSWLIAVAGLSSALTGPAHAEHRVALVIGNSSYAHAGKLANPRNDAMAIADRLQELGFDVLLGTNLTVAGFDRILGRFARAIQSADVALVFYAGHGAQIDGVNYLIPVDTRLDGAVDIADRAISLQKIQEVMERRPRVNLLFFDACRDNPFLAKAAGAGGARSTRVRQGWANVAPSRGTYVAFASAEGEVAADGDGRNSPFTTALLKHIGGKGRDVQILMRDVRQEVITTTRGAQVPWEKSSLVSSFVFAGQSRQPQIHLTADKPNVRKGEQIRLTVKPAVDCRLTLVNVDDRGNSCLLYPNAGMADRVIRAGEAFLFPPPGPKGTLRLHSPGSETFIAMCNASPAAITAATRDTRTVTCSRGPDAKVTERLLEVATFDAEEPNAAKPAVAVAGRRQTILRGTVTVTVTND